MVFLCVKQKTAYEVRIRDWSSDVCASDLSRVFYSLVDFKRTVAACHIVTELRSAREWVAGARRLCCVQLQSCKLPDVATPEPWGSSEERRVGVACGRTIRSRGSLYL